MKRTIPNEHKDMLRFIMFEDQGGSLNKAYQKGLKRKNGDFKSSFWQTVTNKLNDAVEANYTQEVMICSTIL